MHTFFQFSLQKMSKDLHHSKHFETIAFIHERPFHFSKMYHPIQIAQDIQTFDIKISLKIQVVVWFDSYSA